MNFTEIGTSSMEVLTQWGLKVLGAIVVLLIGRMIASGLRRTVHKALAAREVDATLVPFLSKLVYYLTLAVVVIAVLSLFGIQTTSLVAMLGAAGLAIGLALQGTLSHLAAGVMLLIFRPFKVGDVVEVGGTTGKVDEIGVFSTTLTTPDNVKITVPNSNVYGATIKNYNGYDTRRVDMVIGIAYGDDIGKAIQVIEEVLGADERILADPTPQVAVSELADSSVNLVVRPWCKAEDYWGVKFDLNRQIKEALEAAGCSIPFPQHDVTLITQSASGH